MAKRSKDTRQLEVGQARERLSRLVGKHGPGHPATHAAAARLVQAEAAVAHRVAERHLSVLQGRFGPGHPETHAAAERVLRLEDISQEEQVGRPRREGPAQDIKDAASRGRGAGMSGSDESIARVQLAKEELEGATRTKGGRQDALVEKLRAEQDRHGRETAGAARPAHTKAEHVPQTERAKQLPAAAQASLSGAAALPGQAQMQQFGREFDQATKASNERMLKPGTIEQTSHGALQARYNNIVEAERAGRASPEDLAVKKKIADEVRARQATGSKGPRSAGVTSGTYASGQAARDPLSGKIREDIVKPRDPLSGKIREAASAANPDPELWKRAFQGAEAKKEAAFKGMKRFDDKVRQGKMTPEDDAARRKLAAEYSAANAEQSSLLRARPASGQAQTTPANPTMAAHRDQLSGKIREAPTKPTSGGVPGALTKDGVGRVSADGKKVVYQGKAGKVHEYALQTGPRGGKFYLVDGQKYYV